MAQWLPDAVEDPYNEFVAGPLDHAAGSTDEAVGRTFDDEPGGGVIDGTQETVVGAGEAALDVPADAVNATLGTGENLGWFGVIDRQLDPRSWGSEEPDWAEPSDETTGISGFFRGATGATGEVVDETTSGVSAGLMNSPKLLILLAVAALAMLAPYANMAANLAE